MIYLKLIARNVEIKTVNLNVSLRALKIKLSYNCKGCRKKQLKTINGLIKRFAKTQKFCNNDTNKFILLLRKGVYPCEYTVSWNKFNETTLPNKSRIKIYKSRKF